MSETNWKYGAYKKGMGAADSDEREQIGCMQTKRLLSHFGFNCNLTTSKIGDLADRQIRDFQRTHPPLVEDGQAGPNTLRALLTPVYRQVASTRNVDDGGQDWGGCQMAWESALDPASTYTNKDGSLDRGLYQYNSTRTPVSADQAYDPLFIISYRMTQAWTFHNTIEADCKKNGLDPWMIAISANRAPVGAIYWSQHPDVQPVDHRGEPVGDMTDRDWAEFCSFYMVRVGTLGRATWTGKKVA